jgi:hypothetical protein
MPLYEMSGHGHMLCQYNNKLLISVAQIGISLPYYINYNHMDRTRNASTDLTNDTAIIQRVHQSKVHC